MKRSFLLILPIAAVFSSTVALADDTYVVSLSDRLLPGESIAPGQSIFSANGYNELAMQTDGNLVMYCHRSGSPAATWATTSTWGHNVNGAFAQPDGNFVVYNSDWTPLWATSSSSYGAFLKVQDDGNLVVYSYGSDGTWGALWSSNTAGRCY